jgi:hypothetical protein
VSRRPKFKARFNSYHYKEITEDRKLSPKVITSSQIILPRHPPLHPLNTNFAHPEQELLTEIEYFYQ